MAEDKPKDEHVQDLGDGMSLVTAPAEQPSILDKVDYIYTSFAQFMITNTDCRIAFGDRIPPSGKVKPVFGITFSHEHAKEFFAAVSRMQSAIGKLGVLKDHPTDVPSIESPAKQ